MPVPFLPKQVRCQTAPLPESQVSRGFWGFWQARKVEQNGHKRHQFTEKSRNIPEQIFSGSTFVLVLKFKKSSWYRNLKRLEEPKDEQAA